MHPAAHLAALPPARVAVIRYDPPRSRVLARFNDAVDACRPAPAPADGKERGERGEGGERGDRCALALADLRREIEHEKAVAAFREASLICAMRDDPSDPFDCAGADA